MGNKQPIYNKELQSEKVAENNPTVKELEALGVVVNTVDAGQGILSQGVPPSKLWYNRQKSDYIVGDIASAPIIMYQDRPVDSASGYGGKGSNRSQTIDIVVGRMSSARGGLGPAATLTIDEDDTAGLMYGYVQGDPVAVVENSFAADAARIYISQMTDVDSNFGLAEGQVGKKDARSAVAIKADGVRIIGREGVKIVTGRSHAFSGVGQHGELLSTGGSIKQPAPPIELIAGNNDKYLQGVARGENVRDALRQLGERIEEIYAVTFMLTLTQLSYNATLGVSAFEHWRPAAFPAVMLTYITRLILAVWLSRASKKVFDLNYLQPSGFKAIASKNVFSN